MLIMLGHSKQQFVLIQIKITSLLPNCSQMKNVDENNHELIVFNFKVLTMDINLIGNKFISYVYSTCRLLQQ